MNSPARGPGGFAYISKAKAPTKTVDRKAAFLRKIELEDVSVGVEELGKERVQT